MNIIQQFWTDFKDVGIIYTNISSNPHQFWTDFKDVGIYFNGYDCKELSVEFNCSIREQRVY
jgi:hypothetical protein